MSRRARLVAWWRRVDGPLARAGLAVAVLLFGLGWFEPLGRPGYELALVAGLLAPPIVAIGVGLDVRASSRPPLASLRRSLGAASLIALAATVVALVHGVRTGLCEPVEGLTLFVLGPMAGLLVAAEWATVAALVLGWLRRGAASRGAVVVSALMGPLASLLLAVGMFYGTPAIFAFEPFVGFFSGALYDTVIPTAGLWTYRAASLATLVALLALSGHLERRDDGRLSFAWRGSPGLVLVGGLAAGLALASVAYGDRLGHWHTATSIRAALPVETAGELCKVYHDQAASEDAALVVRDCDNNVAQLSSPLGVATSEPVAVYLFRDETQRQALMGAHHTSIAKPWRNELYLVVEDYPHPVLRHELVHVLAGRRARGPFSVAGALGGWLPNPGLIEGFAESFAPRDDELSADEWAAAMRKLGLLPRLERLFGVGFFASASSTSYTAAGSFVSFLRREHGDPTVVRWYGGEALETLVGRQLSDLEREWWTDLDARPLRDAALVEARQRFDMPSVLMRRCPHAVDRMLVEATAAESRDWDQAFAGYEAALALDPGCTRARLGLAGILERSGMQPAARRAYEELESSEGAPPGARTAALERLGDLHARAEDFERARARYREVLERSLLEDRRRTVAVKLASLEVPAARVAVGALLLGDGKSAPKPLDAMARLGEWRISAPDDGVPRYLIARQLVNARSFSHAADELEAALERPLPPLVEAEALRLAAKVSCALGNHGAGMRHVERAEKLDVIAPNRKAWLREFAWRCVR